MPVDGGRTINLQRDDPLKAIEGRLAWQTGSSASTPAAHSPTHRLRSRERALRRAKVPSVPSDPSLAVIDALEKLFAEGSPADVAMIVHGTTVATNALLEGKGVRTGLLITKGFRAVYEARGWSQPRGADLLDTFYQKAAAAGAAIAHRGGDRAPRLRGPGHHPARRGGAARRRPAASRARASRRSRSASCSPSSTRRTSGAPPKSSRRRRPIAASRSRARCCRSSANIRACRRR